MERHAEPGGGDMSEVSPCCSGKLTWRDMQNLVVETCLRCHRVVVVS